MRRRAFIAALRGAWLVDAIVRGLRWSLLCALHAEILIVAQPL
jgi:hypothetical protein